MVLRTLILRSFSFLLSFSALCALKEDIQETTDLRGRVGGWHQPLEGLSDANPSRKSTFYVLSLNISSKMLKSTVLMLLALLLSVVFTKWSEHTASISWAE